MLLSMAKPNTRATTNSATRHLPGIAAPWRAVTPNGVMATLRNVSSAETKASAATPTTVPMSAHGPTHSCSKSKVWFSKCSIMMSGITAKYPAMPSTEPITACPTASSAISRTTCDVVAPASRSTASRSSRRVAARRAAEPARVVKGTTSSTQANMASTT